MATRSEKRAARKQLKEAKRERNQPRPITPRNQKQAEYLRALTTEQQVFSLGPAGTGKTYLAAQVAAEMVVSGIRDRIILCRPTVDVEEKLGFLPGNLKSKMAPWTIPVIDAVSERIGKTECERWQTNGQIVTAPFQFMRGMTFKNAFVLLDEAQNTTIAQMKTFLTRIGDNTTMLVNGDIRQQDVTGTSGLGMALSLIRDFNIPAQIIEFSSADVVRSPICKMWVEAFEKCPV